MEVLNVTQTQNCSNFKGIYGTVSKHFGERKVAPR